MGPRITFCYGI